MRLRYRLAAGLLAAAAIGGLAVCARPAGGLRAAAERAAGRALGTDVRVARLDVRFWPGAVHAERVRVAHPAGFPAGAALEMRKFDARLSIRVAGQGRGIRLHDVRIEGLGAHVVRDREGRTNLSRLGESGRAAAAAGNGPGFCGAVGGLAAGGLWLLAGRRAVVTEGRAELALRYTDYEVSNPPYVLRYSATVELANLCAGAGGEGRAWGTAAVKGHQPADPRVMAGDMHARVAPLIELGRPDFDLAGEIRDIPTDVLKGLTGEYRVDCDPLWMELNAVCRKGSFDPAQSRLTVHLSNVRLRGKVMGRLRFSARAPSMDIPVPLEGTIQEPSPQWTPAFARAALQEAGRQFGEFVSPSLAPDGKGF